MSGFRFCSEEHDAIDDASLDVRQHAWDASARHGGELSASPVHAARLVRPVTRPQSTRDQIIAEIARDVDNYELLTEVMRCLPGPLRDYAAHFEVSEATLDSCAHGGRRTR